MTNNKKQSDDMNQIPDASRMESVVPVVYERTSGDRVIRRAIRYAVIQQVVVLFISMLILDGGDVFRLSIIAALLFWAPVAVIMYWRSATRYSKVTKFDTLIIRYGFWAFFLGMCVLYHYQLLPTIGISLTECWRKTQR